MKLDVLAIGSHPDDVELGCGGTLALLARRGLKFGILHLTRGEAGTRGTAEERHGEAEEAARILGASALEFMDCGDGQLRRGLGLRQGGWVFAVDSRGLKFECASGERS